MRTSEMIIIGLVTAFLATGGVLAVVLTPPPNPCPASAGVTRSFAILISLNGYNDSASHSGSWPVVNVNRCDKVVFNVRNEDTQPHGFAVQSYTNIGLEIVGNDHQTLSFQATRSGRFQIYCTIRCTVHYLMQSGLLNVN